MSTESVQPYISEQLYKFCFGQRCCMKFLGFLFSMDRRHFIKSTNDLSLGMHIYVSDNQEHVIVYKDCCHHIIKEPTSLKIQRGSLKDMYGLHYASDSALRQEEFISSNQVSGRNAFPVVPRHRFSLGPLKQTLARYNHFALQMIQSDCSFQPYKEAILRNLQTNRVIVVNGGPRSDNATVIPTFIINSCAEKKVHCKVIFVEREYLVAIYNGERVAEHFQEKVGGTVAYQIQLQSRISDSSNLVYTTSFFLLRVLMGQSIVDSFRHISHVIVEDVHLHEAYADLLLRELKEALKYHPHLKVILLSNSSRNYELLNYFGEGYEIFLKKTNNINKPDILYLEDLLEILPEKRLSSGITKAFYALPVKNEKNSNKKYLDCCLEFYERMPLDQYFESFLYMVKGECCNINYRHSVTGKTALIIASLLGKLNHIRTLLQLNADPYICDNQNTNAVKAAISMGYKECVDLLQMSNREPQISQVESSNKDCIDYHLVLDILHMINSNKRWKIGNIMVFLPSYQHLVKLNYLILKQKLMGNIPENFMVFLLHNSIDKTDLDAIVQKWPNAIKLILTTDIAESLMCFSDIEYVIDTACQYRCIYNYRNMCKEYIYEWSSKDNLENRSMLLKKEIGGVCFRLISKSMFEKLQDLPTPEILNMNLDRVCLLVKLLSPNTMVAEYLQETIVNPPFIQVHRTVESLKKLNVFTHLEDITWLGCRLIDVPVECYLGKILVFAILLQCLDPVLTIVGFLSTLDPLELGHYMNNLNEPFKDLLRYKIKEEKQRLSEGVPSDHLMYLRLYQEWQNNFSNEDNFMELNEHHFILNGLLEQVCNMRTQLVGSLRSSQLIHSKGDLSMHYINLKSNCWSVIKAALVGGLYPNICVMDSDVNRIKSPSKKEIVLHPNSVLRPLELDSMKSLNFSSPWIVFGKEKNCFSYNSVECNTVVTPITVALFAGPTKITSSSIKIIRNQQESQNQSCFLRIDDWIYFVADHKEALLILKTRQKFYNMYENYLQYCGCLESHNKRTYHSLTLTQNTKLFDCIEKILTQEDKANGFLQPEKIGLRPKALPNQFIMNHSAYTLLKKSCYKITNHSNNFTANNQLHKQFFMVYSAELKANISGKNNNNAYYNDEWYHLLTAMLPPTAAENKLNFVISYSLNPDFLHKIYIAEWDKGFLKLHYCFKCDINLYAILNQICSTSTFFLAVSSRRAAIQLDNNTGEFFLNLFAAHNNWIHT